MVWFSLLSNHSVTYERRACARSRDRYQSREHACVRFGSGTVATACPVGTASDSIPPPISRPANVAIVEIDPFCAIRGSELPPASVTHRVIAVDGRIMSPPQNGYAFGKLPGFTSAVWDAATAARA